MSHYDHEAFKASIRSNDPVDNRTANAFEEVLKSIDTAVKTANNEINSLRVRVEEQEKRLAVNRQENAKLEAEIQQLRSGSHSSGNGYPAGAFLGGQPGQDAEVNDSSEPFHLLRVDRSHERNDKGQVHSLDISTEYNNRIASASWDQSVTLFDYASDADTCYLQSPSVDGGFYAVKFAKTKPEVLGCTSADKSVYVWNHEKKELLHKLSGHTDEVNGLDFHKDQQVMCTASDDQVAIIWDFGEGMILRKLEKHDKAVYGTTFLGNVELQYCVATCAFDQKVRIFDMRTKNVVQEMHQHSDDIIGIACNEHDNCLATGSDDGLINIWETRTWSLRQAINTREVRQNFAENEVKRVSFNPAGNLLAAACSEGVVLVYKNDGGQWNLYTQLEGHTDVVFDVAWGRAQNMDILASASHDKTTRIWTHR